MRDKALTDFLSHACGSDVFQAKQENEFVHP